MSPIQSRQVRIHFVKVQADTDTYAGLQDVILTSALIKATENPLKRFFSISRTLHNIIKVVGGCW